MLASSRLVWGNVVIFFVLVSSPLILVSLIVSCGVSFRVFSVYPVDYPVVVSCCDG